VQNRDRLFAVSLALALVVASGSLAIYSPYAFQLSDAASGSCAPAPNADLSSCNLAVADLSGANLSGAKLRVANLTGANLDGANLYKADLTDTYLVGASLRDANLAYSNIMEHF
jgi:uncharacterized protein YjbI with pentapeptide repeats